MKNQKKIEHHSPMEILKDMIGEPLDIPIDDGLKIEDDGRDEEEIKTKLIGEIKDNIEKSLQKLKDRQKSDVDGFVFEEKIRLLEQTKKAVDAFLLQILSSPSMSTKAVEVLSLIIKVNADILKDISNPDTIKSFSPNESQQSNTQVIIAPSESMLNSIMKERHKK